MEQRPHVNLVVKNLLDSLKRAPLRTQRRVNPCRKLVDGSCPVWFKGSDKCSKHGKTGCPFWFEGQLNQYMMDYYRRTPDALITWLGVGILSDGGVLKHQ